MQELLHTCGCPSRINSTRELCAECERAWQQWMEEIAVPALRRALACERSDERDTEGASVLRREKLVPEYTPSALALGSNPDQCTQIEGKYSAPIAMLPKAVNNSERTEVENADAA